jgi:hypothetical protein
MLWRADTVPRCLGDVQSLIAALRMGAAWWGWRRPGGLGCSIFVSHEPGRWLRCGALARSRLLGYDLCTLGDVETLWRLHRRLGLYSGNVSHWLLEAIGPPGARRGWPGR